MGKRKIHMVEVLEKLETELKELGKQANAISTACFSKDNFYCPFCDMKLVNSRCNTCKLEFSVRDMEAIELHNAPISPDWLEHQRLISDSF